MRLERGERLTLLPWDLLGHPPGTFTFSNLGTMTGTGTTLNVFGFNSFSNSGTVSGIAVVFVP